MLLEPLCGLGLGEGGFLMSLLCGLKTLCIIFPAVLWSELGKGVLLSREREPLGGLVLYLKPV